MFNWVILKRSTFGFNISNKLTNATKLTVILLHNYVNV